MIANTFIHDITVSPWLRQGASGDIYDVEYTTKGRLEPLNSTVHDNKQSLKNVKARVFVGVNVDCKPNSILTVNGEQYVVVSNELMSTMVSYHREVLCE